MNKLKFCVMKSCSLLFRPKYGENLASCLTIWSAILEYLSIFWLPSQFVMIFVGITTLGQFFILALEVAYLEGQNSEIKNAIKKELYTLREEASTYLSSINQRTESNVPSIH